MINLQDDQGISLAAKDMKIETITRDVHTWERAVVLKMFSHFEIQVTDAHECSPLSQIWAGLEKYVFPSIYPSLEGGNILISANNHILLIDYSLSQLADNMQTSGNDLWSFKILTGSFALARLE